MQDLIVAIFVSTDSDDPTIGDFGTGYPVTEDLVLTSRHVVKPENQGSPTQIEVKWFYDQPVNGESPAWIKADLIWTGKGDLDAALIRCRRPAHLQRFALGRLIERKPTEGERWQSTGFARANKRDDVREPGKFGGTLRSMAEADAFFELLEDAKPIAEKQWKGVSGMPIFAGSEILGVVKHVPPNYDHKKLEAVPAWRLLQDEGFRKALGLDEQRERLESARKLLYRLLERSDVVTRDLTAELNLPCGDIPNCREQVVELLFVQPLERLFDLALRVQEKRRGLGDRAGTGVAVDLTLTILPAIHDAAVVSDVRWRKGDANESIISLRAELRTLAEIIMAGADRRAARLRPPPPRVKGYFPAGELSLPEPPESGRDADGKQFMEDWRKHLIDDFGSDCEGFDRNFRIYLKERFIQSDMRSINAVDAEERLHKAVREELRYQAEEEHLTYYYIAEMSSDSAIRQKQETVLAKLKKDFPSIVFLRLAGGEGLDVERRRYRKLCDLLYQDPEANW